MQQRPPDYDWRCPRCGAVNAARTGVCTSCQHDVTYSPPTFLQQLEDRGVPWWRRMAIVALGLLGIPLLFGGGWLLLIFFPTNLAGMAWAAAALLAGAGCLRLAVALDPDL